MGILVYAYPAPRTNLERASEEFRRFREQPTGELARRARASLEAAVSPNDRLASLWQPWVINLIVPLFALANAGVELTSSTLGAALTSPVTLGIVVGFLVGKPVAITATSYLVSRLSGRRLRPPVGWGAVLGAGSAAGIGFTIALLIATLALAGERLQEAKIGVLATVVLAPLLSALVFRVLQRLPARRRVQALLGDPVDLVDLAQPVDPDVDHVRGPLDAPVTVVEYGDFECPYCGLAEPAVRDLLLEDQGDLELDDLAGHAADLGLDVDRFVADLTERRYAGRVARDVDSADGSGVGGTPTFFVNGRRHHGAYDLATLSAAVKAAGARAVLAG
jgi:protein-disulfide isomerase